MRSFRRQTKATTPAPGAVADESEHVLDDEEVLEYVTSTIWAGFIELDDAVTQVADYFGTDENRIAPLVRIAWDRRAAELASGEGTGSYAALASAFDILETGGIIARMNFTCCQTCGHAEIADERGADAAHGYTFFHQQDSERLAAGEVMLAFGAFRPAPGIDPDLLARAKAEDDSPQRQAARKKVWDISDPLVGEEIAAGLRAACLEVDWDGTRVTRIRVDLPDWRKPLPA